MHVLDASRAVPVTTSLISKDQRDAFVSENFTKQDKLREIFHGGPKKATLSLEAARAAAPRYDWENYQAAVPSFLGTRSITADLNVLKKYIDWTPFFHTWGIRGVWNRDTNTLKTSNADGAVEALKLHQDALERLEQIITGKHFEAKGVYGFFPANSIGDDIIVWENELRQTEKNRFHTLRQQLEKTSGKPNVALSDWIAPATQADYIGGFVVGIHGADEYSAVLEAQNDPYGNIMVKALADRFAEAFAEYLHHQARVEWGYETEAELTHGQLIHENYRGIRPAPGYPSQPDHTEKPILFDLLHATDACGVTLTESCAMHPGAAVSGIYFSHPDSHYFAISDLQKDQIEDYAKRKGMSLAEAEKWLNPWLGYIA